jgi:hypothetical protein
MCQPARKWLEPANWGLFVQLSPPGFHSMERSFRFIDLTFVAGALKRVFASAKTGRKNSGHVFRSITTKYLDAIRY